MCSVGDYRTLLPAHVTNNAVLNQVQMDSSKGDRKLESVSYVQLNKQASNRNQVLNSCSLVSCQDS